MTEEQPVDMKCLKWFRRDSHLKEKHRLKGNWTWHVFSNLCNSNSSGVLTSCMCFLLVSSTAAYSSNVPGVSNRPVHVLKLDISNCNNDRELSTSTSSSIELQQYQYVFVPQKFTSAHAQSICEESYHGNLLDIQSSYENEFVWKSVQDLESNSCKRSNQKIHMGLYKRGESKLFVWKQANGWVLNVEYQHWQSVPSQAIIPAWLNNVVTGYMSLNDGLWYENTNQDLELPFVCKSMKVDVDGVNSPAVKSRSVLTHVILALVANIVTYLCFR